MTEGGLGRPEIELATSVSASFLGTEVVVQSSQTMIAKIVVH